MPQYEQFTKDFAKLVFKGEKTLLKNRDLKLIEVTKFDELSVKNLYSHFMTLEGVSMFFPDKYPKGRVCDREYMFNVVNTLHEEVVKEIVDHALIQRHILNEDFATKETIMITDHWKRELETLPLRNTVSHSFTHTISLYRKKDEWFNCSSKSQRSWLPKSRERHMKSKACSRDKKLTIRLAHHRYPRSINLLG